MRRKNKRTKTLYDYPQSKRFEIRSLERGIKGQLNILGYDNLDKINMTDWVAQQWEQFEKMTVQNIVAMTIDRFKLKKGENQ